MSSDALSPPPLSPRLQAGLVALAALAVYLGTLWNGFVYDDVGLVLENPWVRSARGLQEAFGQPLFGFHESSTVDDSRNSFYRPLMHVSLYLLRAGGEPAAWVHHLALVLMHALASVLVLGLLRACLGRGQGGAAGQWASLGGALLFALHPIHTEAVAWVSGWMDVGAALAVLLAARLLVPGPPTPGRVLLAALVWLGGLLFKETAVVLPVLVWAAARATGALEAAGGLRAWALRCAPLALALVPYGVLRAWALGARLPVSGESAGGLRVAGALGLVGELGGRLFWPASLSVVPPSGPVASPWEPRVLLGALLVLGLGALLVVALRRGWEVALAGALWLAVPLLPVLFLQLRGAEAYAERYLYLPSVGFVLLVGLGLRGALERGPGGARALALAGGGVLAACAAQTVAYVPVWHDNLTLWEYTAQAVPGRPTVHANLGNAYLKARRLEEAVPHLERAAAGLPRDFRVRSDLAVAYAQTGRLEQALRELEAAVRLRPDNPVAWHNLGLALRRAKRPGEALARFQEAVRLAPGRAESHLELGRTLLQLGRGEEAVAPLEQALRLKPDLEAARRALASARGGGAAPPAP